MKCKRDLDKRGVLFICLNLYKSEYSGYILLILLANEIHSIFQHF